MSMTVVAPTFDLVVAANRLPVDLVFDADGKSTWQRSPGGLVAAMDPAMRGSEAAWVGWAGGTGPGTEPLSDDRTVNYRCAMDIAKVAAPCATVWVHDYQLQLVPAMLRAMRPDVRIGWFNHIPFPPVELFAQLPWRRALVEGLLGADFL